MTRPSSPEFTTDVVTKYDICFGRGGGVVNRPGNVWYRSLVDKYRHEYIAASKHDKRGIIELILYEVADKDGRFLVKIESATGTLKDSYREVPRIRAIEKTGQALREKYPLKKLALKEQPSLASDDSSQAQSTRRTMGRSAVSIKTEPSALIKKRKSRPPCSALVMPMAVPLCGTIETKASAAVLPTRSVKTNSIKAISKQLFAERSSRHDDHAECASPAHQDMSLEKDAAPTSPLHAMANAEEMHNRVFAEATPAKSISRSLDYKTPEKAGSKSLDTAKKTPLDRPAQFFNTPYLLLPKPKTKRVSIGSNNDSDAHPRSESKREMAILQSPYEIDTARDRSFDTPSSANKVLCFQSPPDAKAANFIPSSQDTECESVDLSCLEGCDCGDTCGPLGLMSPIPLSHITTTRHHYHDGAAAGSCARRVSDASHHHDDIYTNNTNNNSHDHDHDHPWELFDFCLRSGAYP